MLVRNTVFAIILGIICTSCSLQRRPGNLKQIAEGMNQEQVKKILGTPNTKTILQGGNTIWVYYLHEDLYSYIFINRFPFIGFFPLNRNGTEYWLVFQQQRLVAAGKRKDLLDLLQNKYSVYFYPTATKKKNDQTNYLKQKGFSSVPKRVLEPIDPNADKEQ